MIRIETLRDWKLAAPKLGAAALVALMGLLVHPQLAYAGCTGDGDCKGGRVCVNGACASAPAQGAADAGCASDSDCKDGRACRAGVCLQNCAKDTDCPGDEVCDAGACMLTKSCSADTDCPGDWICNNNACAMPGGAAPPPAPEPPPPPPEPAPPPVEPPPATATPATPVTTTTTPMPPSQPYEPPPERKGKGALAGGLALFGVAWLLMIPITAAAADEGVGASADEAVGQSVVPIAGPFIILAEQELTSAGEAVYVLSGIGQIAGLALIILGAVQMGTSGRRAELDVPDVQVTPVVGFDDQGGGLNAAALTVTGHF